jgi:mediator of RNA polymerase II transcription subunit 10
LLVLFSAMLVVLGFCTFWMLCVSSFFTLICSFGQAFQKNLADSEVGRLEIESLSGQMDGDDAVESELLSLIHQLGDAMDIMENLEDENRPALVQTMAGILRSFQRLHELEPMIKGSVPYELIEQIDQGNNPDDYSRKLVEESQQSAKRAEEKQKWLRCFKDSLDASIARHFEGVFALGY